MLELLVAALDLLGQCIATVCSPGTQGCLHHLLHSR